MQTIAAMYLEDVDAFDGLPDETFERDTLRFSPSQVDECARRLYFIATNAPTDETPETPWKRRRARNGTGAHIEAERRYSKMADALRARGIPARFEVVATEIYGEAKYNVNGRVVHVRGKIDMLVKYVGETIPGVIAHGTYIIVDFKFRDKLSAIARVQREGPPSYNVAQMTAYSLLSFTFVDGTVVEGVRDFVLHVESLQKPKESETATKDVLPVVLHVSDEDQRSLLVRLSKVVEAVETGNVPDGEFDKCQFCRHVTKCREVENERRGDSVV